MTTNGLGKIFRQAFDRAAAVATVEREREPSTPTLAVRACARFAMLSVAVIIVSLVSSLAVAFAAGGPMANGGNYTGSVLRGAQDQWTFTASQGNAIRVSVSEVGADTSFIPQIEVHAPDATLVGANFGALFASVEFDATQNGTYTVLVYHRDNVDGAGQYLLTLAQAPGAFIVPAGDDGGPIVSGGNYAGSLLRGDSDQWSFSANTGDAIRVSVSEAGAPTGFIPQLEVHAPNGALMGLNFGALFTSVGFTAPQTGTYTVWVYRRDALDGAGQYLITMAQAPGAFIVPAGDEGGPIVSGGNYAGSLLRGDSDQWSFSANTGDAIRVSVSEGGAPTGFIPQLEVHAPNGALMGLNFGALLTSVGFTAPQTGTYTVWVYRRDALDGAGQYLLTLAQAPGAFIVPAGDDGGPLLNGGNYAGSLLRGDSDQWSFYANADDAIRVSVSEAGAPTGFIPQLEVHAPNGALMGLNFGALFTSVEFTATQTGTYTVWVYRRDVLDGAGQYLITMAQAPGAFIVPAGDDGGAMANGGTFAGSILRGDSDQWTFMATKNDAVRVSISEGGANTAFVPQMEVHAPDGSLIGLNFGDLSAAVAFSAPQTGMYTVWVYRRDASDGLGQYLLNLSGAIPTGSLSAGLITTLITPQRVADTRLSSGPIPTGTSRCFVVAGIAGIPADAGAIVLNVTAVGYGTNGWLTVFPNGQPVPGTSTLNFDTHEYAMANGTIMRVGTGAQVCVNVGTLNNAAGSAQVILDVTGYLSASGLVQLNMLPSPQRVVDTRLSSGPIPSGASRCFPVAGVAGIPADAAAVVLSLTAVGYGTNGWLTLYPNGQPVPPTSTLNFDTHQYAIANGSIVRLGTGGQVCINTGTLNSSPGSSNAILDVTGYVTATGIAQLPMLLSPQRVVDTRTNGGGPIASGTSRCFTIAGLVGLPATATAVVLNVTAVAYTAQGWLTAFDPGTAVPSTSTLNFDTTEYAVANETVISLGGGHLCVNVGSVNSVPTSAHVIIDVVGYE